MTPLSCKFVKAWIDVNNSGRLLFKQKYKYF